MKLVSENTYYLQFETIAQVDTSFIFVVMKNQIALIVLRIITTC